MASSPGDRGCSLQNRTRSDTRRGRDRTAPRRPGACAPAGLLAPARRSRNPRRSRAAARSAARSPLVGSRKPCARIGKRRSANSARSREPLLATIDRAPARARAREDYLRAARNRIGSRRATEDHKLETADRPLPRRACLRCELAIQYPEANVRRMSAQIVVHTFPTPPRYNSSQPPSRSLVYSLHAFRFRKLPHIFVVQQAIAFVEPLSGEFAETIFFEARRAEREVHEFCLRIRRVFPDKVIPLARQFADLIVG